MQTWASVAKSVARSSVVAAAAMMHVMTIILIKQNATASSDPSHQSHAAASERLVSMSGFLLTIDTTYLNLSTTASLHFFQQPTIFPLSKALDKHIVECMCAQEDGADDDDELYSPMHFNCFPLLLTTKRRTAIMVVSAIANRTTDRQAQYHRHKRLETITVISGTPHVMISWFDRRWS